MLDDKLYSPFMAYTIVLDEEMGLDYVEVKERPPTMKMHPEVWKMLREKYGDKDV